jgi:hypothetical protein
MFSLSSTLDPAIKKTTEKQHGMAEAQEMCLRKIPMLSNIRLE